MKSLPIPVPYRTNPGPFKVFGEPEIINAYPEQGDEDNKASSVLVPCAGIVAFGDELAGSSRGMINVERENLVYTVAGIQAYKIENDGTATSIGIIGGSGQVSLARNDADDQQVVIVASGDVFVIEQEVMTRKVYRFENTDGTFETIQPIDVSVCGGYFLYAVENGRFYYSDLFSVEVGALSFYTAEGNPDGLTAVHGEVDRAYLIGPETTEVWGLTGVGGNPFAKIGSAYLNIGTKSKFTVKAFNNVMAMVGDDNVCYLVDGYNYQPFSSKEVERLIEADPDKANIVAFTHERGGNKFYCLQGTDWTREYNAKTGTWSTRKDLNNANWHCLNSVKAFGKFLFGDNETGKLFEADYTLFEDNSQPLEWGFVTNLTHDAPNGLTFHSVELDMETGDGLSYTNDGKVMVSWSDDNQRTWSGPRHLSLGVTGAYNKRIRTHRLGRTKHQGRSYRVMVTDNVTKALAGVYANVGGIKI